MLIGGEPVGVVGELHPASAERLELDGRVALAGARRAGRSRRRPRRPRSSSPSVPRFPPVRRDLAFIVPEDVPAGAVQAGLEAAAGDLLARALLFDVFRGARCPAGRRASRSPLEFRAPDRTLTDDEADRVVAAIAERLRDRDARAPSSAPG